MKSMKRRPRILILLTAAAIDLALSACDRAAQVTPAPAPEVQPPTPMAIGGERDAHGCLPAAGYTWCERTGRCERPWELARTAGFPVDAAAFDAYCTATP